MPLARRNLRLDFVLLVCFFVASGFFIIAIHTIHRPLEDFGWYYYAFHVVLSHEGPSLMYNVPAERVYLTKVLQYRHLALDSQYVYPPQFALLLSFLGRFRFGTSELIWECLSITTYLASLVWLQSAIYRGTRILVRFGLIAVGLIYYPYYSDVLNGNSDWLIFCALSLSFGCFHKERRFAGGFVVGMASVLKVTPVFMLIYFAMKKDLRALSGMLTSFGLLVFVAGFLLGWKVELFYALSVASLGSTSMKFAPAPWNSSIIGVITSTLHHFHHSVPHAVNDAVFLIYALVMLVLFLFVARRQSPSFRHRLALAPIVVLFLSPLIEAHYVLLLLFPLMVLVSLQFERSEERTRQGQSASRSDIGSMILTGVAVGMFTLPGWLLSNVFPAEIFLAIHMLILMVYVWSHKRETDTNASEATIPLEVSNTTPIREENGVWS